MSYAGFVAGEDASLVSNLQIYRTEGEATGEYPIIPSGAVAANYEITYVPGTLTISHPTSVRMPARSVAPAPQQVRGITIRENPVAAGSVQAVFMVRCPKAADLSIHIYDCLGNLLDSRTVRTDQSGSSGWQTWDLRNRHGARINSGTYLIQATESAIGSPERYRFREKLGVGR